MSHASPPVRIATAALRPSATRRAALRLAAARSVGLVLVYHRVASHGALPHEVVPTLASSVFRTHLRTLCELGDVVPLAELLAPPPSTSRPRFAVTFDDDHDGHVAHVLPLLAEAGVPATFFLSGRSLHALPPYWWIRVEESIRSLGLQATCARLGLAAETPAELGYAVEHAPSIAALCEQLPEASQVCMQAEDIRTLARAGMTIGFHTLHHHRLVDLESSELDTAMKDGRAELESVAQAPVTMLAYPYGRVSRAVADAAERAGYAAAFASGGHPINHMSDRFVLGRWDPGALDGDELAAALSLRLLRPRTPSRSRLTRGTTRTYR